jgi:hypothetical protein
MIAHFFDIESILVTNNKVWIVDKTNPNIPILKINQSDFNLIKSGIYKSQGNCINFSGKSYWIPKELIEKIKIKSKNYKSDISNLGFSMQEFMNKELIENIDYEINEDVISHLRNKNDDVYVICSKNTKRNYELIIKKIEEKLSDIGIVIKNYYFISETFYNRNEDQISHKKARLLIQHLIGYKTDDNKFANEEISSYDTIYFYDEEKLSIDISNDSNKILEFLLSNTELSIKDKVKDIIKSKDKELITNLVTPNKVNRFVTNKVILKWSNIVKTFENFRFRF